MTKRKRDEVTVNTVKEVEEEGEEIVQKKVKKRKIVRCNVCLFCEKNNVEIQEEKSNGSDKYCHSELFLLRDVLKDNADLFNSFPRVSFAMLMKVRSFGTRNQNLFCCGKCREDAEFEFESANFQKEDDLKRIAQLEKEKEALEKDLKKAREDLECVDICDSFYISRMVSRVKYDIKSYNEKFGRKPTMLNVTKFNFEKSWKWISQNTLLGKLLSCLFVRDRRDKSQKFVQKLQLMGIFVFLIVLKITNVQYVSLLSIALTFLLNSYRIGTTAISILNKIGVCTSKSYLSQLLERESESTYLKKRTHPQKSDFVVAVTFDNINRLLKSTQTRKDDNILKKSYSDVFTNVAHFLTNIRKRDVDRDILMGKFSITSEDVAKYLDKETYFVKKDIKEKQIPIILKDRADRFLKGKEISFGEDVSKFLSLRKDSEDKTCFRCRASNSRQAKICQGCGETLESALEYDERVSLFSKEFVSKNRK